MSLKYYFLIKNKLHSMAGHEEIGEWKVFDGKFLFKPGCVTFLLIIFLIE